MKKLIVLTLVLITVVSLLAGCEKPAAGGNYTDEMKIAYACDLSPDDGADSVERQGDHKNSPYFNTLDFYNMESSDTLTILPKFKTQQQTSEWSCGVSSALMVLNWYGKLENYNEKSLAAFRSNGLNPEGTSLTQMLEIFQGMGGFDLYSTFDCLENTAEVFTFEYIQKTLADLGLPPREEAFLRRFVGPPLAESFQNLCGMSPEEAARAIQIDRKSVV